VNQMGVRFEASINIEILEHCNDNAGLGRILSPRKFHLNRVCSWLRLSVVDNCHAGGISRPGFAVELFTGRRNRDVRIWNGVPILIGGKQFEWCVFIFDSYLRSCTGDRSAFYSTLAVGGDRHSSRTTDFTAFIGELDGVIACAGLVELEAGHTIRVCLYSRSTGQATESVSRPDPNPLVGNKDAAFVGCCYIDCTRLTGTGCRRRRRRYRSSLSAAHAVTVRSDRYRNRSANTARFHGHIVLTFPYSTEVKCRLSVTVRGDAGTR